MKPTPEQIEATARQAAHMRQLRARFEKLWQEKLLPKINTPSPVEIARCRDLCWMAFKEGK